MRQFCLVHISWVANHFTQVRVIQNQMPSITCPNKVLNTKLINSQVILHRTPSKSNHNNLQSQGKNRVLHTPPLQETLSRSYRISTDIILCFQCVLLGRSVGTISILDIRSSYMSTTMPIYPRKLNIILLYQIITSIYCT